MFTWQLDYQCLPGNRFINVYLETGLSKFTWKSGLSMFTWKLVYQCLPENLFLVDEYSSL